MIHYLYAGHFDHEGDFIRFERQSDSKPSLYRPVVRQPLETAVVHDLLALKGVVATHVPEQWAMRIDDTGFIVWDRFSADEEALDFIRRLAILTGCDLADYSSLTLLKVEDL
jgi:hypothetical protein